MSELSRVEVHTLTSDPDPRVRSLATDLSSALDELDTLRSDRLTLSVEEAAEYSGLGLSNFQKGIRANTYPHFHIGDKEGVAKVPKRALDDFLYEQSMSHIGRKTA